MTSSSTNTVDRLLTLLAADFAPVTALAVGGDRKRQ
jgi:hypothetical protein